METIKRLPRQGILAVLAYIPFHMFLSQWIGTSLGGLGFFKVAKDIFVLVLLVLTALLLAFAARQADWARYRLFILLTVIYGILHGAVYFANHETSFEVAALASVYNNRFLWFFLIAVASGWFYKKSRTDLTKFILILSTIICVLGLLQWFLPPDILTHFGYSRSLGAKPNFFINEDPAYPRVFATIRDPNSLGAFLLIPTLLLFTKILSGTKSRLKTGWLLGLHLLVLYLTFSRAAWVGLVIGAGMILLINYRKQTGTFVKRYWWVFAGTMLIVAALLFSVRHTPTFRSLVLKIDDKNAPTELDSDEYHLHFIKEGISGIAHQPLGHGPGTAGIVSIRNNDGGQLTENYYIQIAYEVGVVGLLIFVALWWLAIRYLLKLPASALKTTLLATAAASAVMCLVMHLWSNEAVAYTWWGLVGLMLANKKGS